MMIFSIMSDVILEKRINDNRTMKMEHIKNREGRIIGIVNGEWLMDGHSKLVARYVPATDTTVTREGRVVGKGDLRWFQLGKNQSK